VRTLVVQVDLALQVLTGVGERQTVESAVRACSRELDRRVHANDASAETDHDVGQRRVAVDARLVRCQVDGVIVPALHRDDRQRGAVTNDDLDVLRLLCGAGVAQHDGRP
jgi:hypothetical protein